MGPSSAAQRHKQESGGKEAADDDDPHGGPLSAKLEALPAEQSSQSAGPSQPRRSKPAAALGAAKQSKGRSGGAGGSGRGKKRSADHPAQSAQLEERKRQKMLLKNRQSAAAFRERVKQYTRELEQKEEELLEESSVLRSRLAQSQQLQSTELLRSNSASMAGLPRAASLDLPRTASLPAEGCTALLSPSRTQGLGAALGTAAAGAAAGAGPAMGGWQQHSLMRQQQQRQIVLMRGQGGREEGEEEEEGHPVAVLPAPASGLQLLFPRQLLQSGQQQQGVQQQQQQRYKTTGPASLDPGASPFAQPNLQEAAQREASPGAGSPTFGPLGLSRLESAGSMPGDAAAPACVGRALPGADVLQGLSQAVAGVVQAALASGRVQELPPLLRMLAEGVVQEKLNQLKAGRPGPSQLEQHLMAAAAGSTPPAVPALPSPCLPSSAAVVPAGASAPPLLGLGLKAPLAMLPCASQPLSSSGSHWQLQRPQGSGMGERPAATAGLLSGSCTTGGPAGSLPFLPHTLAPSLGTNMVTTGLGSSGALKRDPTQPGWQRQAALQFIPTADPMPPSPFEVIVAKHGSSSPSCMPLASAVRLMPAALGRSGSSSLPTNLPAGMLQQDGGSDATVELPNGTGSAQLSVLQVMDACLSPLPLPQQQYQQQYLQQYQQHHASPQTPALHPDGIAQQAQQAQQARQARRQQELLGHIRQLTPQQFKAKMGTLTSQQQQAVKGIIVRRKLARSHAGQQGQQGATPAPPVPGAANNPANMLHSLGASSSSVTGFQLPGRSNPLPTVLETNNLDQAPAQGSAFASLLQQYQQQEHEQQYQQQEHEQQYQQQEHEQQHQQQEQEQGLGGSHASHWLTFPPLPLQPEQSGEGLSVPLLPAVPAPDRCGSGLTWLHLSDDGDRDGDLLQSVMELQRCWSPSEIMTP